MFSYRFSTALLIVAAALCAVLADAQQAPVGDPMRPYQSIETAGVDGSASRAVALTAVIISPNRRIAVIDGGLYREGDEVAGARISRIESRVVHLARDGEVQVVSLDSERAREPENDGDPTQ